MEEKILDGSPAAPRGAAPPKKQTGGAAFPIYPRVEGGKAWTRLDAEGMTLRDYFAAKALAGFCAAPDERRISGGTAEEIEEKRRIWARNDAEAAYRLADAMLSARNQD